jgi:ribosome-interacting GTPase 1
VVNAVGRINISHPSRAAEIEDRVGCYVIFYKTGADTLYVAYVGFSTILRTEVIRQINRWDINNTTYPFTCLYIPNSQISKEYEDDLIRYYCPPWNTRFTK